MKGVRSGNVRLAGAVTTGLWFPVRWESPALPGGPPLAVSPTFTVTPADGVTIRALMSWRSLSVVYGSGSPANITSKPLSSGSPSGAGYTSGSR